jgi:hypothetical protein
MDWVTQKKMHLVDIGSTKQFLQAFLQPCSTLPTRPQDPSHSDVIRFLLKLSGATHCHAFALATTPRPR